MTHTRFFKRLCFVLVVLALFNLVGGTTSGAADSKYFHTRAVTLPDGTPIQETIINGPPTPPEGFERSVVEKLPEPDRARGVNILSDVPAFSWSFGCSATSAAMIAGYYDRTGYDNMYAGPTNGGVMPMDNSSWPDWHDGTDLRHQCPLSATHNGLDGRTIRGGVDDYWISYGSEGPDPYVSNGWTEHTLGDSTGDFMKTNRWASGNTDGSTTLYNYNSGAPLYWDAMESGGIADKDGGYGIKLFYESRGYTVTQMYNQYIMGYSGNTQGFTFAQYKAEIDAGRPVMIHVTGHTMVGIGYDDSSSLMYIHDTWDHQTHTMTWGGDYEGMTHYGVTIVQLATQTSSSNSYLLWTKSPTPTPGANWTFLVYLDADNNLEEDGLNDFLEMAQVGSNSNINIVVQFDRVAGHSTAYGDWQTTKRFLVTNGMTPDAGNALADLGEANMGDPATLTDFINWGTSTYPATNYALVLWNHGGGWREEMDAMRMAKNDEERDAIVNALKGRRDSDYRAVCWDDTNSGDSLQMKEVKNALNTATTDMTLLGFDACVMGMIEVAYEIKDTGASVMVGSEDNEPGGGWPYDTLLGDLAANPTWSAAQLGTAIVNRYYESYSNSETQAAIDLTQMTTLASTVSSFADTMRTYWNSNENAVKTAAQNVMNGVDAAVIHEQHGAAWVGANGLAIAFPTSGVDSDYNGTIIDFPGATSWDEFLTDFATSMGGSWIDSARVGSQTFGGEDFTDLYHFCDRLINPSYCMSAGSDVSEEYVSLVQLNGASNATPNTPSAGYSDFTGTTFTTLAQGASYTITVANTVVGTYTEYVKVWFDFNQDLDFDDAGEAVDLGSYSGSHTFTHTFTVPAGATTGNTRMRVVSKYVGETGTPPTACESYSYGETEDYTVSIQSY